MGKERIIAFGDCQTSTYGVPLGFKNDFECEDGFHLESEACEPNVCTCSNGEANGYCQEHDSESCETCSLGFHLFNGTCLENSCVCNNGLPATGEKCFENDLELCMSCDKNYALSDFTCLEATCPQGFYYDPSSKDCKSDPCPTEKGDIYHFDPEQESCQPNVCRCENGVSHDVGLCLVHEGQECISCNPGFRLNLDGLNDARCKLSSGSFFYHQMPCNSEPCCGSVFNGPCCAECVPV